uniref:Uncharacterized protein n=1 Tax=viral metagenome TaxID=1070528 RepID=A0A6C0ECZ7_9ZZZZ
MTEINIKLDDLNQIVKTEIQKVLFLVADQYKINQREILEKILSSWKCDLATTYSDVLKNKRIRPVDPENFCFARKPNLDRCTRGRKKNSEYCASHQYTRPSGRIDEEPSKDLAKKNKNHQVMIQIQPKTIDGKPYFIDNINHLYVLEKNKLYRWIGDWDEAAQTIKPKNDTDVKPIVKSKSVKTSTENIEQTNNKSDSVTENSSEITEPPKKRGKNKVISQDTSKVKEQVKKSSAKKSVEKSVPVKKPASTKKPNSKSVKKTLEEPTKEPTEESAKESVEKPVAKVRSVKKEVNVG